MNTHPLLTIAFAAIFAVGRLAFAQEAAPANLGGGLRELADWHAAQAAPLAPQRRAAVVQERLQKPDQRIQSDAAGRVVVDVYLNGVAPEKDVSDALTALGARVLASVPAGLSTAARHGVISAFLPIGQATAAAKLPGVQSIMLVHQPKHHVGSKTSQGLAPLKVLPVQRRKFQGSGITVGVISDSYDMTKPDAAADVKRSDLPGVGNRAKHTTPINVLGDGDPGDTSNTDEGRAMLQIVHDVAPESALAFCAVGATQATFVDAIRRLRTEANCDVIVDDIVFNAEPMFSDGIVAKAVDEVVTSTALAGKKVIYFSAAGNSSDLGYEADFAPVSDSNARNGNAGTNNLQLGQVPTALTDGGFHNFTAGTGTTTIVQRYVISGDYVEINFQWNDLFDAASMTSDFNVLVFDEAGKFLAKDVDDLPISGVEDAFATGQAQEDVYLAPNNSGVDRVYQIAITRRNAGSGAAHHFRYFVDTNGNVSGTLFQQKVPSIHGHSGARSGNGVAAYAYNQLARPEDFSSFGPVSIHFDDAGTRLANPEIRQQPTLAAPDGVATSMVDFRPFFGTSAAAPHAAAVAALILNAKGGPGFVTADAMRSTLQTTTSLHDLDPQISTAESSTPAGTVTLTGDGDASSVASASNRFFTLHFTGPSGAQLNSVLIDLTRAGLKFDADSVTGFPFTVGDLAGGATAPTATVPAGKRKLLLKFTSFPPGATIRFGIDRDVARTSSGGNSGDELAKGVVTATILPSGATKTVTQKATFGSAFGAGFTPADGFGFINADAALKSLGL